MTDSFLNRTLPIIGAEGLDILSKRTITIPGLGGVGGGAFLALVRMGCTKFRLAKNGIFDPPDMNRQAGAFGHTMDRPKLDVYVKLARSINPEVEILAFPDGINPENIEDFIQGVDVYAGVIDAEKGEDVKAMTPALLEEFNVPMFTCGVMGFGAISVNHKPGKMMPGKFWEVVTSRRKDDKKSLLPDKLAGGFSKGLTRRLDEGASTGIIPTLALGGLISNALLANEIVVYLPKDSGLIEREAIFAPQFVSVDLLTMQTIIGDVSI